MSRLSASRGAAYGRVINSLAKCWSPQHRAYLHRYSVPFSHPHCFTLSLPFLLLPLPPLLISFSLSSPPLLYPSPSLPFLYARKSLLETTYDREYTLYKNEFSKVTKHTAIAFDKKQSVARSQKTLRKIIYKDLLDKD